MLPISSPPTIDPLSDELLTDSQVAKRLGVTPITVWRYRTKGRRKIQLPAIPYGHGYVTTEACIRWWFAELQQAGPQVRPQQRRRQLDPTLEAECEAAGI